MLHDLRLKRIFVVIFTMRDQHDGDNAIDDCVMMMMMMILIVMMTRLTTASTGVG